ncbi:hypothetical protein RclHR1_24820001 [Rhizophagus clarus]|uniref:Uncharacterized protein n=1 Tax=Rhizophagus clarus TaxID=94130 RepID=A0A2Z6QYI2_9GLOM|nr:hypothetical protein RclHR1_24820001 [Rhizophagus clarus]
MDTIIRKYWRKYALAYKQWEKSLHITKRDKRLYRKRRSQDNEPNTTPEPSLSRPSSLPGTRRRDDIRRLVYAVGSNYLHSGSLLDYFVSFTPDMREPLSFDINGRYREMDRSG